ncbi:uncharacterized protein I206_106040 [Kwoniella pini CBS 10737]|uniref:Uncharacterized protein n=1 Tax=Kwoniella pini CBS 10737 TaxID=1296096 RepID=A0A1B9I0Y3_9TREE|nr:uncharacterized protein I206_04863 [Kwoniella pini CBS 10737]OCF49175.1 hypothetical protein I206_04863 [Kwoniella pini CBS 10737]
MFSKLETSNHHEDDITLRHTIKPPTTAQQSGKFQSEATPGGVGPANYADTLLNTNNSKGPVTTAGELAALESLHSTWSYRDGESRLKSVNDQEVYKINFEADYFTRQDVRDELISLARSVQAEETKLNAVQGLAGFNDPKTPSYDNLQQEYKEVSESLEKSKDKWNDPMKRLFSRSMTDLTGKTIELINKQRECQKSNYGSSTKIKIPGSSWKDTFDEALWSHFDKTVISTIAKFDPTSSCIKDQHELTKVVNSLLYGKITTEGDKDSITCIWRSESTEPQGIIGLTKKPIVQLREDSRIISETGWTWKDGHILFFKEFN